MERLQSYLAGRWQIGQGEGTALIDPTSGETIATASAVGLSRGEAVQHARDVGGPALRALSFAERAAALAALSSAIHAAREELIEIGVRNAGNTRSDAKFDIDGATGTLAAYAAFGRSLPGHTVLSDDEPFALARSPRFVGRHVSVTRPGIAVHVNAFNFPAWGLAEKLAVAILAGVPVIEKPGTPTAWMAERIAQLIVDSGALPPGAFSCLVGEAGDLFDHLGAQDAVAFTGSSGTARTIRGHAAFIERGTRLNVEADSLNAAVLLPDVAPASPCFDLFVRDTVREITQKAGQKCTATRRILVARERVAETVEALVEGLSAIQVGDPRQDGVRMGPLVNEAQVQAVLAGTSALLGIGKAALGGAARADSKGCFVRPALVVAEDPRAAVVHAEEVFGPVATVLPWSGDCDEAAQIVALGQGQLVASVYSDDRELPARLALALAPWSGRLYLGSERMAEHGTGAGTVLPSCVHGGPGRAGGGEELGGLRGLSFYMQRTAVQGFRSVIEGLVAAPQAATT